MYTKLITGFLVPPGIIILLFVLVLLLFRRRRGLRALFLFAILSGFYLISTPWGAMQLLNPLQNKYEVVALNNANHHQNVGAIIVLSGGNNFASPEYGTDTPNMFSLERVRFAANMAKQIDKPILLSGGAIDSKHKTEAKAMEESLRNDFNITSEIWLEEESKNTNENSIYSTNFLEGKNIKDAILITHAMHMPRAMMLFNKRGLDLRAAPTGYKFWPEMKPKWMVWFPQQQAFIYSSLAMKEYLGITWAFFVS